MKLSADKRQSKIEYEKVNWQVLATKNVAKSYFNNVQFTTGLDDKYGSTWQRMICKVVPLNKDIEKEFWNTFGKKLANQMISRRRQNVTGFMKKKFESKCGCWRGSCNVVWVH